MYLIIFSTGSGDVDTSTVVKADADGCIVGASGSLISLNDVDTSGFDQIGSAIAYFYVLSIYIFVFLKIYNIVLASLMLVHICSCMLVHVEEKRFRTKNTLNKG